MDFQEVGCGGLDWIDLAQDMDRWWSFCDHLVGVRRL